MKSFSVQASYGFWKWRATYMHLKSLKATKKTGRIWLGLLQMLSPFIEAELYLVYGYLLASESESTLATRLELLQCLVQFSSVTQSCPILCDPMNHSTPTPPSPSPTPRVHSTHVHRVSDAIQPSHPLSSPSPPAPSPSQHHSLFQWVNSSHEVAKVLEFQH